ERDGHRGRLARRDRRSRAGRAAGVIRLSWPGAGARAGVARAAAEVPGYGRRGCEPDRRCPGNCDLPAARVACADGACSRPVPGMKIALRVNGAAREAEVWPGESLL